jgi:hypothetical protein
MAWKDERKKRQSESIRHKTPTGSNHLRFQPFVKQI